MGWIQNLFSRNAGNNLDYKSFMRYIGSMSANKFSDNPTSQLEHGYGKNVDVYVVIRKIVDVLKSVPWVVEQQMGSGEWKILKDTPIHQLMDTPNVTKGYTWNDIEEMYLIYLLTTGNAYIYGESAFLGNTIDELDILPTPNMFVDSYNNDFFLPQYKFRFNYGSTNTIIEKEKLCHIRYFNPAQTNTFNSVVGLSPIQVAAMVIQAGNDGWEANATLRQNRGVIGMVTDKSNMPMSPDDAKIVQAKFNADIGGPEKFGRVHVTNKDLSYIQMAMSPQDLQLIEGGVVNLRSISALFGLSSMLFNDPLNKTYANWPEAVKDSYLSCYIPLSDKVAEHLTRFICPGYFPGKRVRMRQDFTGIDVLQTNKKETAEIYGALKEKGIYTPNEVRIKMKDELSKDENADKLTVSSSVVLLSNIDNQNTNTPPATT